MHPGGRRGPRVGRRFPEAPPENSHCLAPRPLWMSPRRPRGRVVRGPWLARSTAGGANQAASVSRIQPPRRGGERRRATISSRTRGGDGRPRGWPARRRRQRGSVARDSSSSSSRRWALAPRSAAADFTRRSSSSGMSIVVRMCSS